MKELLTESVYFGVTISIVSYGIGLFLKKKLKWGILNPLLVSILFVVGFLILFDIDYDMYNQTAKYLSYLLTPATVALAIPLYQKITLLKKNGLAVFLGILSGVLSSLLSVLAMAWLFGLSHRGYVTLLPKSITTAIGMGVSDELGGITTITVAVIIVTGVLGNVISLLIELRTQDFAVSAGASGAVFAVMGAMIYIVIRNKGWLGDLSMRQILVMAAFSLYFGFASTGVDNTAHVGGMVSGFFLAVIFYHSGRKI